MLTDEPGDAGAFDDGDWNDADTDGEGPVPQARVAAAAVPEVVEAGFLPRDGSGVPAAELMGGPRGGFASGGELDTALPGVALAAFADEVTGADGRCGGASDDELILRREVARSE